MCVCVWGGGGGGGLITPAHWRKAIWVDIQLYKELSNPLLQHGKCQRALFITQPVA